MPYRLNNKFVSKATYEAAMAAEQEAPTMSEGTRTHNVSPFVLATRELTKAKSRLERAEARAAKVQDVRDELDAAREAYEEARDTVQGLI